MKIIFHIGMHKTASTYLQQEVFPLIDKTQESFSYNSPIITKKLHKLLYRQYMLKQEVDDVIASIKTSLLDLEREFDCLLFSDENFSQTSFYQNYLESYNIVNKIFPNAIIVLFLRKYSDWVYSCYKQSLKMGDWQPFKDFVSYKQRVFLDVNKYNNRDMLCININHVSYLPILNNYRQDKLKIFFYEDFKKKPEYIITNLLNSFLINNINFEKLSSKQVNKSFDNITILRLIKIKSFCDKWVPKLLLNYRIQRRQHYDLNYNEHISDIQKRNIKLKRTIKIKLRNLIYKFLSLPLFKLKNLQLIEDEAILAEIDKQFVDENKKLKGLLLDKFNLHLPEVYMK